MSMTHAGVVCNRCAKDIEGEVYPNENWCRECEPVQMNDLRDRIAKLEAALIEAHAEVAKAGCCDHEGIHAHLGNCMREKLLNWFRKKRKALEEGNGQ